MCRLNFSDCLHNGLCLMNDALNTTYCQCDACNNGPFCENHVSRQTQFYIEFICLIIYITILSFSLLNNSLALELFIRCKQIRCTNCGTYLIVYAVLSLLSSILLVTDGVVTYYRDVLSGTKMADGISCYFGKIGYNALLYLCVWLSACVTFERGLFFLYGDKINASRWRSFLTIITFFAVTTSFIILFVSHNCDWDNASYLQITHEFFVWLYLLVGITIYVLGIILAMIAFTRRLRRYTIKKSSIQKTFLKLLQRHFFIFVPPITYVVCFLPYTIFNHLKDSKYATDQCSISTAEYISKLVGETLHHMPVAITWLIFVYPSRVYMSQFYLQTWSGKFCVRNLMFVKSFIKSKNQHLSSYSHTVQNKQTVNIFVIEIQPSAKHGSP